MINNPAGSNVTINISGQQLGTLTDFKYFGANVSDEGSKPEVQTQALV